MSYICKDVKRFILFIYRKSIRFHSRIWMYSQLPLVESCQLFLSVSIVNENSPCLIKYCM